MQNDNQQQDANLHQAPHTGKWIRTARKEQGLTQKELAKAIDVDPKYLSRIENGHGEGSPKLIRAISSVLGKPFSYFYQDNPNLISDVELEEEIAEKLNRCSKYKKMIINNIIDAIVDSPDPTIETNGNQHN